MSSSRDDFGIAIRSALLQKGAKQKFSLFFFICFSIFIFFLDSLPNKLLGSTKSLLNDGIYRVSFIATSPFKIISYSKNSIKSHFFTYSENKTLKDELQKLKSKDLQIDFLITENTKLKQVLDSKILQKSSTLVSKVLLDKKSPFLKSVILNKGSSSGVKKGMPVVDNNFLVGRIVEVNYLSSRVLLLNDLNSKLPVTIEPSAEQAMISGLGQSYPKLDYLPEIFQTKEGDKVFTSGKDGIFSPGIPIGNIFIEDNILKVKLFSDPNQLSYVGIVIDNFKEENF